MDNKVEIKDNKVEIKPIGSYFELDPQGFIKNPASLEKIQSKWLPAIKDVTEVYKNVLGDKLINIYIRLYQILFYSLK